MNPIDFEDRVKNPDTMLRKIAQHRLEGKQDYGADDVNDVYGGRFIVKTPEQFQQVLDGLRNLDKQGVLTIKKEQKVDKKTYHAYHIDFTYKGVNGEIQIHTPQTFLESVVNHDIRAKMGENPPPQLDREKKLNARVAQKMPDNSATLLGKAIEAKRRQVGA